MKRAIVEVLRPSSPKSISKLKKSKHDVSVSVSPNKASTPLHRITDVSEGKLIRRYKRFLADVALDAGEIVTAHCPNTGPLLGLLDKPSPRVLVSRSANPKRKCAYTLEAIELESDDDTVWIGVHSALANAIVHHMLKAKMIPELDDYNRIKAEVPYGKGKKSRADFLLTQSEGERQMFVEVKAATYSEMKDGISIGRFPDAKSTRAHKHLEELMSEIDKGNDAAVILTVMGNRCTAVGPFEEIDAEFTRLLREAQTKGVLIIGVGLTIRYRDGVCDFDLGRLLDINLND